jgi:Tfp pilus assembly protein FimT
MSGSRIPGGWPARLLAWVVLELLVVIAVLALWAWMALPRLTRRRRRA